ncbi:unnamed protein product [Triticum turgidum subsp. durum]|uniref:F-box protein AT5G49610-like beta-propeller domain-containing protein n=1 Tax=Triticum turgidum subsp. durum TaxID=4567 RepID=A0A9R1ANM8_TRITD|nr:unnamed protein product [Triticum turgidum subsp. durum]
MYQSACLYESKSGVWGNIISTPTTGGLGFPIRPSVLVGNALCWLLYGETEGDILKFDFTMQKLVVIEKPLDCEIAYRGRPRLRIVRTEESGLGLIGYTGLSLQLWERKVNYDDVATWVLQKTIDLLENLLPVELKWSWIHGYDEDDNVIFLCALNGSLMVQLDSIQFGNCFRTNLDGTTPPERKDINTTYIPYKSFYAAGNSRFLHCEDIGYVFTPTLDPPDRIPAARFSLPQRCRDEGGLDFVECHHGLALFLNKKQPEAVVWNPISGHQHRVAFPPEFGDAREREILCAAVLCAAGDDDPGHVHGDCGLSSFKLALVRGGQDHASLSVCLYKSKSGLWGNVISTTKDWYTLFYWRKSSVLIGNALYWWCCQIEGCILEFDFKMQKLVTIEKPVDGGCSNYQIMRTEESSLGLIILTELTMQLWERKVSSDDVATWVLQKTIELTKHLWPRQSVQVFWTRIHGYEEDHNVIFLGTSSGSFMIQLDSMQFNNRFQFKSIFTHFPYTSFYAADWAGGGRDDGTEMSSSTSPNCPIR